MPIETEIAKNVLRKEAESILRASERIGSEISKAVKILYSEDNKIIVSGIGKSGHLGKKMSATFCSTGSPSAFLHPSEAVHGDLGIHQNGDPVIFISNSGNIRNIRIDIKKKKFMNFKCLRRFILIIFYCFL